MVVCVGPHLFFRFNSYPDYPISVLVPDGPQHPFLQWPSYIEVSESPIELDDHLIGEAIRKCGGAPLGQVDVAIKSAICKAVAERYTMPRKIRADIQSALGCPIVPLPAIQPLKVRLEKRR
nr:hypothetical protein [Methylobacterium sp. ZNC0032]